MDGKGLLGPAVLLTANAVSIKHFARLQEIAVWWRFVSKRASVFAEKECFRHRVCNWSIAEGIFPANAFLIFGAGSGMPRL